MPKITPTEIKPFTGTKIPGTTAVPLSATDRWVYGVTILATTGDISIGDSAAQDLTAPFSFNLVNGCCYNLADIYVKGSDGSAALSFMAIVPK